MGCDQNPEYLLCIGCIGIILPHVHVSNEKNPGWLVYIGDYTTQLYGDCNKPL